MSAQTRLEALKLAVAHGLPPADTLQVADNYDSYILEGARLTQKSDDVVVGRPEHTEVPSTPDEGVVEGPASGEERRPRKKRRRRTK